MSLAKKNGFSMFITEPDWRLYIFLAKGSTGVLISNSVDGTIALRVDAIICFRNYFSILVGRRVQNIYRRHTKTLSVEHLEKEINEIYNASKRYKAWVDSLFYIGIEKYIKPLKSMLEESFPKVYYQGIFGKYYFYKRMNLKDFYEELARRIWSRDTDIRTKIALYKKLNDMIMSLGVVELL